MGEIFKFSGRLSLISSHFTSRQCPSVTFCRAFSRQHRAASGSRADFDGPSAIAFSMRSRNHFGPQSTGQPLVAYSSSVGPAG